MFQFKKYLMIFLVISAWGCKPNATYNEDVEDGGTNHDGGEDDAGTDAGPMDSGIPQPISLLCNTTASCKIENWQKQNELPQALDHHFSWINEENKKIYVFGGMHKTELSHKNDVSSVIYTASIAHDGAIGKWEIIPTIPLAFHSGAQSDNGEHVLISGGFSVDSEGPLIDNRSVHMNMTNGELMFASGIDNMALHSTLVFYHDRFILIGGYIQTQSGTESRRTVQSLKIDGEILSEEWVEEAPLPRGRTHHVSVIAKNRIYVLAGFDNSMNSNPENRIYASIHGVDGAIIDWEVVGEFPMTDTPWASSAFVEGDTIFILGGGYNALGSNPFSNRVQKVILDDQGLVLEFQDTNELPYARSHSHQSPRIGKYVYSLGGRIMNEGVLSTTSDVWRGELIEE